MGLSNSRDSSHIMRVSNESRGTDSMNEDSELADAVEVLNYLILSGQLNLLMSRGQWFDFYDFEESDDSEFDYPVPTVPPPRVYSLSNTANLNRSDIKRSTERICGLRQKRILSRPKNVVNMINMHKNGMPGSGTFTHGDMCKITNYRVPCNFVKNVDKYNSKASISIFSDDGSKLLTISHNRNLHLYDSSTSNYKYLKQEKGKDIDWTILDAEFTPDGNTVIFSSWSNNINAWRINDDSDEAGSAQDKLIIDSEESRVACFSVSVSFDGAYALTGANDGCIYLYDRHCAKRTLKIHGHDEDVNAVKFGSYSDDVIFSGSDDGLIKVWDRRTIDTVTRKPVGIFSGHRDGITYLDMKGDGRHFISNSKDQSIKLWDMRKFSKTKVRNRTRNALCAPDWDYRWQPVPKKVKCKTILPDDTSIMTYRGHAVLQTLVRAKFSPAKTTGQRFIYTGCASGRVVIYDLLSGKIEKVFNAHDANVRDVSWHCYRQEIVTASWDNFIKLWDSTTTPYDELFDEIPTKRVRRSARIAARMCTEAEKSSKDIKINQNYNRDDAGPSST